MKDTVGAASLSTFSSRSANEKELSKHDHSLKAPSKNRRDLHPRPSHAAAWAWHQRSGGGTGGGNVEVVRSAREHAKVRRASRFKEEAMRVSKSTSTDDTVFNTDSAIVGGSSLFDSYELISLAKQLEEALTAGNCFETGSYSPPHRLHSKSSYRKQLITNIRPSVLPSSSMETLSIKNKMEHLDYEAKSGSENGCRTHFLFGNLSRRFSFFL